MAPWHRGAVGTPRLAGASLDELAAALDRARGVIVAGAGVRDPSAIHAMATAAGWPVLADPRSGCRVPVPTTVAAADALLRHHDFARDHTPDVVVRFGRPLASKVVNQWLEASCAMEVQVGSTPAWIDPEHAAAWHVVAEPGVVARALADRLGGGPATATPWLARWRHAEERAQLALTEALAAHLEPTEPGTARSLVAALPDGSSLVVSSSMPVRDVEWYGAPRRGLRVFANRGANGIDGVVSTAVGVALGTAAPTALLIGDIALLHDANGLVSAVDRPIDLLIVVVDNRGGGIFSFLPQREQLPRERFEQLFGTPHDVDPGGLASLHGITVEDVEKSAHLSPAIDRAVRAGGVRMVVVRTSRDANVAVHDEIHAAVATALDRR
jgi:2-succinyl-5-enolpyruvyl-6-hydroxy-3-cyclohexene-1-carboxylate synthase